MATATRRNTGSTAGVLGQLPRRTSAGGPGGAGADRPGNALNFGRPGTFGRLGATAAEAPASAATSGGGAARAAGASGQAGSRRLGTFNSLAAKPVAADVNPHQEHELDGEWAFWFMHRNPTRKTSEEEFNRAMKRVGSCQSVEAFYALYLHLRRPSSLAAISDIHLFLHPIKPFWEDPANSSGGKWTIRLRKGLADRLWETIVLGLIGGGIERGTREGDGDEGNDGGRTKEICGAVLSVRREEDILAVWHKSGDGELGGDGDIAKRLKATLQSTLSLPPSCQMVYKLHFK